jgi:hypothetical protein
LSELVAHPKFGHCLVYLVQQLPSRNLGHVTQTIDHFVQDKLTRAVFCIGMLMAALKLRPALRTTVAIDLRRD